MSHSKRAAVLLTIFLLFAVIASVAQEVTATITGTVTDPSGAPVAGASVVARDVERGTTYPTQTNSVGVFNIQRIPVGSYAVNVTAQGFQTIQQPPATLVLNQVARFEFKLKVKGGNEVVEVLDEAPILQADNAQVGTLIDAKTNDNLPLASRNFVQLSLLAPGAVSIDPTTMNTGSQTTQEIAGNGGGRPYINGNREQSNNFLLDGIDNNQASENAVGFTPSPDAIQEFNLITQNASSEFGNYQGGIVSATLKSGTNGFHGDIFEFFRNDILNANSWINNLQDLPKAPLRWNLFGGTIGGPIVKNKLFFFADYEGSRFDFPPSQGAITVLTTPERSGNFGGLCTAGFNGSGVCNNTAQQIYDPCQPGTGITGGSPCVLTTTPVPFANNIIPTNRLDKAFTTLVNSPLYPAQTASGGISNAFVSSGRQFNDNQGDIKVDYNLSQKDRLFGRYSQAGQLDPQTTSFLLTANSSSEATIRSFVIDETHNFSPTLINDVRIGVNYVLPVGPDISFDPSVGALATAAGIQGATVNGINGLPEIAFTSASQAEAGAGGTYTNIGNSAVIQKFASTVAQLNDNLIWSHGKHNLKFGYQMNQYRLNIFYPGNYGELGIIGFSSNYTSNAGTGGDPAASFALGLPDSVGRGVASGGGFHQRDWLFAGYVQDDWRVHDTLTLNVGVRYEARTPWVEINNRQSNVDIINGNVALAGQNGASRGLYNSEYGLPDLQPRVGFAWTPAVFDRKTVIRGAYSVSSYLEGTGTNLRLARNPPFTPTQSEGTNTSTPGSTPYVLEDGPAAGAAPVTSSFNGATMYAWSPLVQPAIAQQWNLTLQQQLATNLTLQLGYVGQKATHLVVPLDLGQNVLTSSGAVISTPYIGGYNAITGNNGGGQGYGPNNFADVYDTASVGTMRYDALQAVLQKRSSNGLEGQVSYTWGKCMTNNSGYYGTYSPNSETSSSFPYWQNLYDPKANWARCFYDATQILSAYAVYELPVGHGKPYGANLPAVANAAIGGWSVNPIFSYHTGFPLAIYGSDVSGTFTPGDGPGPGSARPDCNGPVTYAKQVTPVGLQWFANDNAFSQPTSGFGNCPAQGPVIGPGYVDVDVSLQKNFRVTESMRFQFRADFLNAFNHVNFAAPNMYYGPPGTGSAFGLITGTQDSREIEFALKFYW
jgi:carboxypeptidase family protein